MMFLKVANVSSAALGSGAWLSVHAPALNSERFYQQPLRPARPGPIIARAPEIKSEKFAIMITNKSCQPPGLAGLNSCQTNLESGLLWYPHCDHCDKKFVCFMDTRRAVTLVIPDQNMSDQTIFEIIFGLRILTMRQQRDNVLPSVSCGQRLENKELCII